MDLNGQFMLVIIMNTNGHQKYMKYRINIHPLYGSITVLINKEIYQPYLSAKYALK